MPRTEKLLEEAFGLIDSAGAAGLGLRLLGGLGVRVRCPSAVLPPFAREYSDVDCIALGDSAALQRFLSLAGWEADREFNLYNGDSRLLYASPSGTKLDVFVETFSMCHAFGFSRRLPPDGYAAYPAELLLTKLQIHEINDKDLADAACLLLDHELSADDSGLNGPFLASTCSGDWGVYHSIAVNLGKARAWAEAKVADDRSRATILSRIDGLLARMEGQEKGLAWRLRSAIGTRVRWYEDVEEVDR